MQHIGQSTNPWAIVVSFRWSLLGAYKLTSGKTFYLQGQDHEPPYKLKFSKLLRRINED